MKQEKYDEALYNFNKAIVINKFNVNLYNYLGLTHSSQNNYKEAISCFDKAINIDPTNIMT
jgi:superkiller protein 3